MAPLLRINDVITSAQVFISLISNGQLMCKIWSAYHVILGHKWNTSFLIKSSNFCFQPIFCTGAWLLKCYCLNISYNWRLLSHYQSVQLFFPSNFLDDDGHVPNLLDSLANSGAKLPLLKYTSPLALIIATLRPVAYLWGVEQWRS